jgi:hypothetical protein
METYLNSLDGARHRQSVAQAPRINRRIARTNGALGAAIFLLGLKVLRNC